MFTSEVPPAYSAAAGRLSSAAGFTMTPGSLMLDMLPDESDCGMATAEDKRRQAYLWFGHDDAPQDKPQQPVIATTDARPFLFRGLLYEHSAYSGISARTVPNSLHVRSTPERINEVQEALGRQPGKDAFELTVIEGGGDASARLWLGSIAEKSVVVADRRVDPFVAKHDTTPSSHVQSWFSLPGQAIEDISSKAINLSEAYAPALVEAEETGIALPDSELKEFLWATENLESYTKPLFRAVAAIDDSIDPAAELMDVTYRLNQPVARGSKETVADLMAYRQHGRRVFRGLGILFPSNNTLHPSLRKNDVQLAGQIARNFMVLEEVQPKADDTTVLRDARIKAWRTLIDRADAA